MDKHKHPPQHTHIYIYVTTGETFRNTIAREQINCKYENNTIKC